MFNFVMVDLSDKETDIKPITYVLVPTKCPESNSWNSSHTDVHLIIANILQRRKPKAKASTLGILQ